MQRSVPYAPSLVVLQLCDGRPHRPLGSQEHRPCDNVHQSVTANRVVVVHSEQSQLGNDLYPPTPLRYRDYGCVPRRLRWPCDGSGTRVGDHVQRMLVICGIPGPHQFPGTPRDMSYSRVDDPRSPLKMCSSCPTTPLSCRI